MRRIRDRVFDPAQEPVEWRRMLEGANVPDRYWHARPAAIVNPQIREWVERAVAHAADWLAQGAGFFLCGPPNTGKSSVASILVQEALRRAERCLWLPVRDVPRVRFGSDEEARVLDKKLRHADVVVIDDLGAERFKLSGAAGGALEETLRIAYDRSRSVIVTCNYTWEDFQAVYNPEAGPLVSAMRRLVWPVAIVSGQWPDAPLGKAV